MTPGSPITPHGKVAVAFAAALVEGDFVHAREMLAPILRHQLTADKLCESFYAMFRSYASGEPRRIQFDEALFLTSWPGMLPEDIGWAYVSILGDDFVEGVAVIVADLQEEHVIREIIWGRP